MLLTPQRMSSRAPRVVELDLQIEICAFAVMSNHYHLVLFIDKKRASALTREGIVARWTNIFGTSTCVARYQSGEALAEEREHAESMIELWRRRLYDISWFMKSLNEHLARRANAEDNCTGNFWKGRFKSQALLDDAGAADRHGLCRLESHSSWHCSHAGGIRVHVDLRSYPCTDPECEKERADRTPEPVPAFVPTSAASSMTVCP